MVKTSSKLSKVLSMLIVVSMVLSSMAFTLPVSAAGTELFFEDFNTTDYNSANGTVDTTVVTSAYLDGTKVDGTTVTWQAAADGTADATTQIKFEDGVLKMNKGTHSHGGQLTTVSLATGMENDTTSSGYIVFETDFKPTSISAKSSWNNYSEGEIYFTDPNTGAALARVTLGQTNGLQDLLGSSTNADTYAAVDANAANGVNYKDNMGTAEDLEGKDIKVRVVWDLANKKTLAAATVDGETGARVSTAGWHAVATGGHVKIGSITLKALSIDGSTPANYQFDNVKLTKYLATDALSLTDSTVTTGATDVATAGTITLTFSDDIDAGSIGNIKLKKSDETLVAPDSVEMSGTNAVVITYSDLDASTAYSITTDDVVLSSETGLPVKGTDVSFTTAAEVTATAPEFVSSTPADGAEDVAIDADITVAFDKAMDAASLDNIKLYEGTVDEANVVALTDKTMAGDNMSVTFSHADFDYSTDYVLVIPTTVKSGEDMALAAEETATFTTIADPAAGTLLWSENFDGLTAANIMTERPTWSATVGNYAGSALTSTSYNNLSDSWAAAATDYTSKLAFADGKLVLGQKRNTEHGSENVSLTVTFDYLTTHPTTGYTIFEYDYYSNAVPVRNRYNERDQVHDIVLNQKSGSGRTYGVIDVTSTNGIQDMLFAGAINSADAYNEIAAGTHKENVRRADDIAGKTVHMAFIYDIENLQYNIAAQVDGEYTFLSSDWTALPSSAHPQQFFDQITFKLNECNTGEDAWTEVSYDNFTYKAFETLPAWAIAPEEVIPDPVTVASTSALTNVAIDADITVTFSKAINADEAIDAITLMNGATPVDFAATVEGAVLTINPDADLAYGTTYTLTLPNTITATDNGVFDGDEYEFTTVDAPVVVIPAPTVVEITPANNATGVAVNTNIVIEFSKEMNFSTLTNITIKAGETPVAYGTPVVVGNEVTITPEDDLANGTIYTVEIPNTVLAEDTGVFEGATYTFTTEVGAVIPDPVTVASIVPADEATGIAIDANIVVTFSKAINDTTLADITLKAGDLPVAFEASVDGAVLTINPDADLANGTTYTVTLPATIVAADGGVFDGAEYTFTTVAAVTPDPDPTPSEGRVLWSQNFDAMSDLSGDALNTYMATNYSNWSAQIGTAPTQYQVTNYNLGTGFTWSEGLTKYVTADNKGGLVGFANGRVKLGIPSYMGHGSTQTKVTIPVGTLDMENVNYAVFEFDYYSDKIAKRGANQNFNDGNIHLVNSADKSIARISIGTAWGIQDIADLTTLNATTLGDAANNLGEVTSALLGKTIHFTVVFDIANNKYIVSATPEGAATTTRLNGTTPWISLPDGTTFGTISKVVMSEKDALNTSGISISEYDNLKITGYETLPYVVSSSIANGATGIATDGSIVLTFSDEIDANTIGGITFKQGASTIDIAPVVDGTTVTVPYDALAGFTAYTLTVPSTVSSVNGLPVAPEYTLTFTTGERIAPTPVVSEINPADEATDVSIYSDIVIEFSVPMTVDTLDDILLKNEAGEAIGYTFAMSNNDKVMTITPDDALAVLADYTVTIPVTVISAEDKPFAEEVTTVFTTADYPITSSNVLWSENFDGLTEGRDGWSATIANYTNAVLSQHVVDGSTVTWDMAASEYTAKVVFEDGKLKIGEKGNTEHGGAGASITIPVTLSGAHPTTGYTVFEYDYFTDAMATRNRNNEYTNHDITLAGGKTIYMLDITSTNGVQTLLGATYSSSSKDDYLAVINGTHKENIRSSAGMSGKTAHIQVVFDLEQLTYKIFVEVDGNISTLSDEWTALPAGVTVENFVSTLTIKQNDSNTGSSNFTLAQYDNFKYSAYDVLPQAMGASTDGLTSVAIDSEIVVTFNGVLGELNTDSISFTADGEEVEFTAEIVGDGNKIKITPAEDLPYSAMCEIKFADNMTTTDGYIMSGSTIEFITEPRPVSFVQTGITFKDEAGNIITSIGASTEVHVEGVFENTTGTAQKITKIIVAYDASGKKLKSAFVTDTIAANDSKTVNLDLDIDGLGATTIKVFAIDSFANLTPMISTEVLN